MPKYTWNQLRFDTRFRNLWNLAIYEKIDLEGMPNDSRFKKQLAIKLAKHFGVEIPERVNQEDNNQDTRHEISFGHIDFPSELPYIGITEIGRDGMIIEERINDDEN